MIFLDYSSYISKKSKIGCWVHLLEMILMALSYKVILFPIIIFNLYFSSAQIPTIYLIKYSTVLLAGIHDGYIFLFQNSDKNRINHLPTQINAGVISDNLIHQGPLQATTHIFGGIGAATQENEV